MMTRPPILRLSDFLIPQSILLDIEACQKPEVLRELTRLLYTGRPDLSRSISQDEAFHLLAEREMLAATGIGNAIAVPHASSPKVKQLIGGFARSLQGIEFGALDRLPCQYFFVLLSPTSQPKIHIKALSRISRLLTLGPTREALLAARSTSEIYQALMAGDEQLEALRSRQEQP
ncbi:MAG: PTS sugar transporter subunit IIA [Bradymonadales bacterium]|nr:PTS sugar transporter subunit IIA [Bradymonadales bacterium]